MKRASIVLALVAFLACALAADTSAFYPVRVDVIKVYMHADGYRVLYRKGASSVGQIYLPGRWFTSGGKAELIRDNDPSFPYMTIFYKDGKFDHLRLYVLSNTRDESWGVLTPAEGAGKFDSDDFKIDY
jgi:hypothetical protein